MTEPMGERGRQGAAPLGGTDIETVRASLERAQRYGVLGQGGLNALSRIERVVEAARDIHVESQEAGGRIRVTRSRYAALREALLALDE